MKALASRIVGQIGDETEVVTEIPNLTLHRFDEPTKPTGYLLEPSVCMILQGLSAWSLATMITSTMRPAFFVTSIDLPLIAQILEASPSDPYVGMTLKLDRMQIAQLILDSQLPSLNSGKASRAIELGALSKPLFGAIERLIDLLAEPECIPVLHRWSRRRLFSGCSRRSVGEDPADRNRGQPYPPNLSSDRLDQRQSLGKASCRRPRQSSRDERFRPCTTTSGR